MKPFVKSAAALLLFAMLMACSDDSSSGTNATAGINEPESSEASKPGSANSTRPNSAGSSETSKPESTDSTEPTSSASSLTPLQEYEQARDFIDDGWRDECLKLANVYRASEEVAPLTLADDEKQLCAITQAAADMADNKAHGHFKDCGEWAQNSGPNFTASWLKTATDVSDYYLEMMWNEKKLVESGAADLNSDADYGKIGHYKNMRSASYTKVACGIALSADGKTGWFNVNFF